MKRITNLLFICLFLFLINACSDTNNDSKNSEKKGYADMNKEEYDEFMKEEWKKATSTELMEEILKTPPRDDPF